MSAENVTGRGGLSLNCAENPRDLSTIHEAMRRWPKRWRGQTEEMKDAIVQDVDAGRKAARSTLDNAEEPELALQAIDRINTAARVHLMIEAQVQADDHAEAKAPVSVTGDGNTINVVQVVGGCFRNV